MTRIYTGKGDDGTTSLIGGRRVLKSDDLVEVYGSVDELSAFIGLLHDVWTGTGDDRTFLIHIQRNLQKVEAFYASEKAQEYEISPNEVAQLEERIDCLSSLNGPVKEFIIPGGNMAASCAHVCRTVCRRIERRAVKVDTSSTCLRYINRLSDYFFELGRMIQSGISK